MTPPIKEAHLCAFRGPNITHVIDSTTHANDRYAKPVRTTQGIMWKCGNCLDREHDDFILKQAPDSPLAREIIAKRRREIEDQKKRLNSLIKSHKLSGLSHILREIMGTNNRKVASVINSDSI